ncbi:MAG: succinylglutamate desuccinylase/aspartoacylase family protein [Calditrichaceae bacterium]|nr:succinylglutamate desuccinylase/aspartoacylase family protein [Calditrichaceae bacterium]
MFGVFTLIVSLMIGMIAADKFQEMHETETLYPSYALTEISHLSDYNPNLKNTNGNTEIYFFNSDSAGGTVLILGGTHPNEPAGFLTACLILENLQIKRGRLIIIPRANNSAFTHNDPQEGQPQYYTIEGIKRERIFRFGSRITNSIDQWPDPEIYLHYPSGQKLAGNETRNLNRAYPGRADGNLTEQMAYGIIELINKKNVDLAFDLHEAAPEYPVVNAIVASERSQLIATEAAMELQFEDLIYSMEPSPYNFHGLSHREWQDYTQAMPILLETANPIQGRLRGKTDVSLLLTGRDPMYLKAAELGELHVPYDSAGISIEVRVGRHLSAIKTIIDVYSNIYPDKAVEIINVPDYEEIVSKGIEEYF